MENTKYKFSIIIPVVDEYYTINQTIKHINSLKADDDLEIIVVDGSPTGETIKVIENKGIKKLITEKGRGNQMNKGASIANGEILIFLHADTYLPPNALHSIASAMRDHTYIGGAFDLGIDSDRLIFRVIEKMASLRSRITRMPYGDQVIFLRKDYFNNLGGFKSIPIMEDVDLMRRIKKRKGKIYIIEKRVKTSPRRWEKEGVLYCTLRNWVLITLYFLGAEPEKLIKFYR